MGTRFGTGVLSVWVIGAGVGTGFLVTVTGFSVGAPVGLLVAFSEAVGVGSGDTEGGGVSSAGAEGAGVGVGVAVGVGEGVDGSSGGTKGVNVGFAVGVGLGVGVSYSYFAIARTCTLPLLFGTDSSIALIVRRSGPAVISV